MHIRFWGVRGSIAAPGPATVRYGGNTSCVELTLADGTTVVLDAGTGIREMGIDMLKRPRHFPIHILLSHHHWDHIQGFPFFLPIYNPQSEIRIYPFKKEAYREIFALLEQMDGVHFPVDRKMLPSNILVEDFAESAMRIGSAEIRRMPTNHPGGGWSFDIRDEGRRLVYMTDNELAPPELTVPIDELADFASGADVLIHDAQYTLDDLKTKRGWGHSAVDHVLDFARRSKVRHVVLFHHDPDRADDELDVLAERARVRAAELGFQCSSAAEGGVLDVDASGVTARMPPAFAVRDSS